MNLLFELLLEELPNTEMVHLEEDVYRLVDKTMNERNIPYSNPIFYLTPRRMALKLDFEEKTKQENMKIIGPPKNVCYKNGKPTKALEGFLRKNNASEKDLIFENSKKGEYAVIIKKGEILDTRPLIIEAIKEIFNGIHFYKKMRWGRGEYEYVRPVHNVLFLINDEIVNFEFMGKRANRSTLGHRFMSNKRIDVTFSSYESKLEKSSVIVDQNKRKTVILEELKAIAKKEQAELVYDEDLLKEVVNLVEYPVIVTGKFGEKFLKLPKEVLITSMKDHQRYFAFIKNGRLLNKFAAVSNIKTKNMNVIRNGYEKVLKARFSDAEFFFEEDKKHKLEEFVDRLDEMLFHEKLGTQLERTNRLIELAGYIANLLGFSEKKAKRAAYLSKADLLTQMVYEFPELQGIMGREYALISGEDKDVAQAIYEQYLPRENEIPETEAGICLSVADKVDIIVGGFFANFKPTGTKDPYGLRRAALGIIRTVIENRIHISLMDILKKSAQLYGKKVDFNEIIEFFKVRFRNLYNEFQYNLVESVIFSFDDIYEAYLRLSAINEFLKNDPNKEKQFAIKRIFNIVKEFEDLNVDETLFIEDEEKKLFKEIKKLEAELNEFLENRQYYELIEKVASIKDTINSFFDKVMVMEKDEKIRNNRLSLLNRLRKIVLNVSNFKYLEI